MTVTLNVCYRAIARVQNNGRTEAFLFESSNGILEYENYKRATKLIEKGTVENLVLKEITPENGEKYTQIRGYNCNLTKMPTFKTKEELFKVYGQKIKIPSEYRIKGTVILNTNVVGYKITNVANKQDSKFVTINTALGLIENGILTNGIIVKNREIKCTDCDILSLPKSIMDCKTGSISSDEKVTKATLIRYSKLKSNGTIKDIKSNTSMQFHASDYLVVKPNGTLTIMKKQEFEKWFTPLQDRSYATCDAYLETVSNYSVEFFGKVSQRLNPQFIKTFAVAKRVK